MVSRILLDKDCLLNQQCISGYIFFINTNRKESPVLIYFRSLSFYIWTNSATKPCVHFLYTKNHQIQNIIRPVWCLRLSRCAVPGNHWLYTFITVHVECAHSWNPTREPPTVRSAGYRTNHSWPRDANHTGDRGIERLTFMCLRESNAFAQRTTTTTTRKSQLK